MQNVNLSPVTQSDKNVRHFCKNVKLAARHLTWEHACSFAQLFFLMFLALYFYIQFHSGSECCRDL